MGLDMVGGMVLISALGSWRQEVLTYEASLGYTIRFFFQKRKKEALGTVVQWEKVARTQKAQCLCPQYHKQRKAKPCTYGSLGS